MPTLPKEILIVDDIPDNLDLLAGLLEECGYRVRAATSGRQALESVRLSSPDLIMLDIMMPDMDGYETCRRIKEDEECSSVPVIFISALDDTIDKVRAFKAGAADYVTKPFQSEEVVARVEHQLRISTLQKEIITKNRSLEEANLRMKELDQMKSSLTAMLVHDIRSPLTHIGLALELYRAEGEMTETNLLHCEKSLHKVVTLLQDMLEIFKSESSEYHLELAPVSLRQLLEEIRLTFSIQAQQRGLSFEVGAEDLPNTIFADYRKLDRSLSNLIGNSLKFTPGGGSIRLKVDVFQGVGVDAGVKWLRLEVTDTGRGIPAEQLPYVFDPYRQTSTSDRDRGVGLGLAIVQRIVAAHKGRISVQSQMGIGTTFKILLPLD